MNSYVAEVIFGNSSDLPNAIGEYNTKASQFLSELKCIELKYKSFLTDNKISMGVETVDNIEQCIIKLKPLPERLPQEIMNEIIDLFNTIWSQK